MGLRIEMPSLATCRAVFLRHLRFVGPGLVAAVAYIDPGNWATDLQAGAQYGYKLLFVVLVAGLAAVVLQTLAVRLGTTTSTSLAFQTRQLFLRLERQYPKYRVPLHIGLWVLYIFAEVAIIGTDLAELIGSAVALNLLFPALPLWAGVLITAADVLIILIFFNSSDGRKGMLFFEIVIVTMVLAVFVSFAILLHLIQPEWKEVFLGLLPSATLVAPGATYTSIGIIGATVMPHALFLGSSLASVDRLDMVPRPPADELEPRTVGKLAGKMPSLFGLRKRRDGQIEAEDTSYELDRLPSAAPTQSRSLTGLDQEGVRPPVSQASEPQAGELDTKDLLDTASARGDEEDTRSAEFSRALKTYQAALSRFDRIKWVDLHLKHASIDTIISLLGFALTINAAILTLAGAAFFYADPDSGVDADDATLQGAFALLSGYIGRGAGIIFALALLLAGQSASITATLAGQVVSEGFINWRTSPFWRRLITRLIGVIPAAAVAAAAGPSGLNTMLVASQVLLSIVLPTVIFPLVFLCSREDLMTVRGPSVTSPSTPAPISPAARPVAQSSSQELIAATTMTTAAAAPAPAPVPVSKSYKSPKWITITGYLLFGVVVLANCYVIVQLGLGNGGQ